MAKNYCIMCGKERSGLAVQDDAVLASIRWFKRNVTHNERNSHLVVCRDCYASYKKELQRHERRRTIYTALGILFFVVSVAVSPRIGTVIVSFGVLALLGVFSLMTYVPRIRVGSGGAINKYVDRDRRA